MNRIARILTAALAFGVAAFAAPAQEAQQGGDVVTASFGDWEIRCAQAGAKACVMEQTFVDDKGQAVLQMEIRRIKPRQANGATLDTVVQVTTPLGSVFPAGIQVKVDDHKERLLRNYFTCVADRCILREPINAEFVAEMKKGVAASVVFAATNGQEVGRVQTSISLKGFTAAYDSLEPNG